MSAPAIFATGNLVFPRRLNDAWALYRLKLTSYDGLPASGKLELLAALARLIHHLGTDVTIHRVTRTWSAADYTHRAMAGLDPRHGHRVHWQQHLDLDRELLEHRNIVRPEVWLAARLPTKPSSDSRACAKRSASTTPKDSQSSSCEHTRQPSNSSTKSSARTSAASAPPRWTCNGWSAVPTPAASQSPTSTSTTSPKHCYSTTTASCTTSR